MFEQIISSMSDAEFDDLLNSVRDLREFSIPVEDYLQEACKFSGNFSSAYTFGDYGSPKEFSCGACSYSLAA